MAKTEKVEKRASTKKGETTNLHDFAKAIEVEDVSSKDVYTVLQTFCNSIAATLTSGEMKVYDKINLPGLGAFVMLEKKPRNSRNPKTGETFMSPARKTIKFKMAASLKIYGKAKKEEEKPADKKAAKKGKK